MILIIDNYDSFTYNLAQYVGELGAIAEVIRNDAITLDEAIAKDPSHLIISPGPGEPKDAGISCTLISHFAASRPVLGVCLGHQCIAQTFGGEIIGAERLVHGKTSPIYHTGEGIFHGLPSPFEATRYHSLMVNEANLPKTLTVTAQTAEGELMGVRYGDRPVEGVQFHPESILTKHGKALLANFLQTR